MGYNEKLITMNNISNLYVCMSMYVYNANVTKNSTPLETRDINCEYNTTATKTDSQIPSTKLRSDKYENKNCQ